LSRNAGALGERRGGNKARRRPRRASVVFRARARAKKERRRVKRRVHAKRKYILARLVREPSLEA
jgi:hypothetical protein